MAKRETGWLIETLGEDDVPRWWQGPRVKEFTAESDKAARFCRQQDAEVVAQLLRPLMRLTDAPALVVTEHEWVERPPAPKSPSDLTGASA